MAYLQQKAFGAHVRGQVMTAPPSDKDDDLDVAHDPDLEWLTAELRACQAPERDLEQGWKDVVARAQRQAGASSPGGGSSSAHSPGSATVTATDLGSGAVAPQTANRAASWLWESCQRDIEAEALYEYLVLSLTDHLKYLGVAPEQLSRRMEHIFRRVLAEPKPFYVAERGSPRGWVFGHVPFGVGEIRGVSDAEPRTTRAPFDAASSSERGRRWELLQQAVEALSPELRVAFVLYEAQEFAVAHTAEALGVSEGTVHVRLRRARAEVAAALPAVMVGDGEASRLSATDDPSPVGARWCDDASNTEMLRQTLRDWRDHPPAGSFDTDALQDALFGPADRSEIPSCLADDASAPVALREAMRDYADRPPQVEFDHEGLREKLFGPRS